MKTTLFFFVLLLMAACGGDDEAGADTGLAAADAGPDADEASQGGSTECGSCEPVFCGQPQPDCPCDGCEELVDGFPGYVCQPVQGCLAPIGGADASTADAGADV